MGKVCLAVLACGALAASTGRAQQRTTEVLTAAREALGGAAALADVRAFRATGGAFRDAGPLRVTSAIELLVALPDAYRRTERISLGGLASEMVIGFRGETLFQHMTGPSGQRVDPATLTGVPSLPANAAATGARQDVARLLLGLFAASPVLPAEFVFGGTAESPDGTADVIDVRGADGFEARLFVDSRARLPLMVSWTGPDVAALIKEALRPGANDASGANPTRPTSPPTTEHRLYFADYRAVGALRWPFRVRRTVAGALVEELAFERFEINPSLPPDAFDADRRD